ncbi:MAG: prepilin peptidase [Proteobacteria bacterium]|nr:prepilin peptidase [Pseudomonadota bacterium]
MMTETSILIFSALFGAVVGSFLNVVILRLPEPGQSIAFPASHCPQCSSPLRWFENIPILSYIILLGRCGHCKNSISLQYPLVELLMAIVTAALVHRFQLSLATAGYFVFSAALLIIIFIDIRLQIIPDVISLPGIILGFIFSLVSDTVTWQSSLIGLLAGGGVLYAVALSYAFLRKIDGMGGGDIKLLAMIGAWLGWQALPFVILMSSATGSIIGIIAMRSQKKGGQTRIPFGPFLSLAALVHVFFSEDILLYYSLYLNGQWP